MSGIWSSFDSWAARMPVSTRDVSIFRILYAALLLINPPINGRVYLLPEFAYRPPWGPFRLIDNAPTAEVFAVLSVLVALSTGFLLVGWFTRTSSLAVGVLQIVIGGLMYSYGKIDHTILLAVVPLALAWSSWGEHYSVDSVRRSSAPGQGWAHRLLALAIGVAFATAGIAKVLADWLDPTTQATRGYFISRWYGGVHNSISEFVFSLPVPQLLWESLDYFTIALELGMIVAALHWPTFRIFIALATLFHLGVLILLGIAFPYDVIAYGAFVSWASLFGKVVVPPWLTSAGRAVARPLVAIPVVLVVAAGSWSIAVDPSQPTFAETTRTVVVVGAAAGAAYLVGILWRALRSVIGAKRVHDQP